MAFGLPGYDVSPMNYSGKDNILFHLEDDMSVFLKMTATTDMNYQSNMTVTQNPVMSGANVADNFSRQPKSIAITGVVVTQYSGAFFTKLGITTVEDFVATVERWRDEKRLVRVICRDGISLRHAVIQNFQARKNKEISNGLNIDITFVEIDLVREAQKARVAGAKNSGNGSPTGAKTQTKGVQKAKDAGNAPTHQTNSNELCQEVYDLPGEAVRSNAGLNKFRGKCEWNHHSYIQGGKNGKYFDYTPTKEDKAALQKYKDLAKAQGNNPHHGTK